MPFPSIFQQTFQFERKFQKKLSIDEDKYQHKDVHLCKVCMDNDVHAVFLPCGHLGKYQISNTKEKRMVLQIWPKLCHDCALTTSYF